MTTAAPTEVEGSGASGDAGAGPAAPPRRPARPARPARRIALAVGLVVALLVVTLATRRPASDVVAPSPIVGQPAPDIEGPDLNGVTTRLSELRGRYVVVNFFATWCVPCVQEHPELVRFADRHPAEQAQVLMVVYDDQPSDVRAFLAKRGGDWPVVDDPASKVDFGVRGVPESFLVAPDGFVLSRLVGGVTADGLDRLISQAEAAKGRR
ncbi:MAG TPA: TlpA disulfide reductase family protein [Acidimicrobiales bacterium]|nr:TlpA disulfide reductase family protein [Acidimicrobiales bacterium]